MRELDLGTDWSKRLPRVTLLVDTPATYGAHKQVLAVNAAEDGLEWASVADLGLAEHVLATTAGLGAAHTVSGLTVGQVLRATGATGAAFAAIQAVDLPDLSGTYMAVAGHTLALHEGLGLVPQTRSVIAGNGLSGGGTLAADRTLAVALKTASGLEVDGTGLAVADGIAGAGLTISGKVLAVGAGAGVTVAADAVAVDFATATPAAVGLTGAVGTAGKSAREDHAHALDLTIAPTWTGAHTFQATLTTRTIAPELTDTYDLGSSTRLWRKGYLSEMDAVLFAENTITLLGGWLIVSKDEGTIAADVAAGDTTVDFGKAMTTGHFVVFRAVGQVEYMQVGAVASGNRYNVTRNLDGSGANSWAAGVPFLVLGTTGDGRIELNAYDTPRINILTQGATYNAQTELARWGDLNGNWGYATATYGFALGEYAASKANLVWDPTNGLRLRTYSTTVLQLDQSGNADITGKLRLPGTGSALAIGATPPTGSSAGTGIWIDRTGLYALASGVNQVWLSASDGCLHAGTDMRISNGMIRIRDASPAATIAWRNATDTAYIGYLLTAFGDVGIGFAFNDAAGYFFSDKDARIGGGLYVGGTETNPAAGYVEALYDVMPYGTKRGVWRRFVEVSGNTPTDHFSSGGITSGYAWAGSPFATPSTINYSRQSDYLGFLNSGAGRYFMYKGITNNAANWQGKYIEGRFCAAVNGSVGLRVDDGTDNNYAEVYLDNTAADGANTLKFSYRAGGGSVTTATAGCKFPVSEFMVLRLLCYWSGAAYSFYGYVIDETGGQMIINGFNTPAVTWCPAAGRAGIVGVSTAACGYLKCDWFYTNFS